VLPFSNVLKLDGLIFPIQRGLAELVQRDQSIQYFSECWSGFGLVRHLGHTKYCSNIPFNDIRG
jgi:hypothetical protein